MSRIPSLFICFVFPQLSGNVNVTSHEDKRLVISLVFLYQCDNFQLVLLTVSWDLKTRGLLFCPQ